MLQYFELLMVKKKKNRSVFESRVTGIYQGNMAYGFLPTSVKDWSVLIAIHLKSFQPLYTML